MRRPPPTAAASSLFRPAALALLALLAAGAPPAPAATLRLTAEVLGAPFAIEVIAPPAAEPVLREAVAQAHSVESLVALDEGPLAALNAAAGAGPQPVPAELLALLQRALDFCSWSEGVHGPLGGRLYELWGLRTPVAAVPRPGSLDAAVASAACDRLQLDAAAGTATLAAGSRLDLWAFARGAAVDAAVDRLAAQGYGNASVTLGDVQRAVGAGPDGDGWPLLVPVDDALAPLVRRLALRDSAFALASLRAGALRAGGAELPPYVDQRQGRPPGGVVATAAVTQRALDAEGLAVAAFLVGNRRGAVLLAQLQPKPSALWLLGGQAGGTPLVTDYHWGLLPRLGRGR